MDRNTTATVTNKGNAMTFKLKTNKDNTIACNHCHAATYERNTADQPQLAINELINFTTGNYAVTTLCRSCAAEMVKQLSEKLAYDTTCSYCGKKDQEKLVNMACDTCQDFFASGGDKHGGHDPEDD